MRTTTNQPSEKLKREDGDGWSGRTYTLPETETEPAQKVPSVTTILGIINKPALVPWAAKVERELVLKVALDLQDDLPEKAPKMTRLAYQNSLEGRLTKERAYSKQLSAAGEIGSQIHALIEWNLRKELGQEVKEEPKVKDKALWGFMVYEDWRKNHSFKPVHIEQQVWSRKHRYAGTMDWLAHLDGVLTVGDWKSGKAIYDEALLQVAAYVMGLIEMGHAEPPVNGCIVRLPKVETDPEPEMKIIPWGDIPYLFKHFLAAREMHNFASHMKSGQPIPQIELVQRSKAVASPDGQHLALAHEIMERFEQMDTEPETWKSETLGFIECRVQQAIREAMAPLKDRLEIETATDAQNMTKQAEEMSKDNPGISADVSAPGNGISLSIEVPLTHASSDAQELRDREEYTAWLLRTCATDMAVVKQVQEIMHFRQVDAKYLTAGQRSAFRLTVEDRLHAKVAGKGKDHAAKHHRKK